MKMSPLYTKKAHHHKNRIDGNTSDWLYAMTEILLYTPDYCGLHCWFKKNVIWFANKQFEAVYTMCVFLLNV